MTLLALTLACTLAARRPVGPAAHPDWIVGRWSSDLINDLKVSDEWQFSPDKTFTENLIFHGPGGRLDEFLTMGRFKIDANIFTYRISKETMLTGHEPEDPSHSAQLHAVHHKSDWREPVRLSWIDRDHFFWTSQTSGRKFVVRFVRRPA
jgi:hypothetical protein